MAISRSQLVKELEPGLNALFGLEYSRYENEHAEIFITETSDRAFEEEVMLTGFSGAEVKQEGAPVVFLLLLITLLLTVELSVMNLLLQLTLTKRH
jgi:hypothetical protein